MNQFRAVVCISNHISVEVRGESEPFADNPVVSAQNIVCRIREMFDGWLSTHTHTLQCWRLETLRVNLGMQHPARRAIAAASREFYSKKHTLTVSAHLYSRGTIEYTDT
jgi:hypothetical protein